PVTRRLAWSRYDGIVLRQRKPLIEPGNVVDGFVDRLQHKAMVLHLDAGILVRQPQVAGIVRSLQWDEFVGIAVNGEPRTKSVLCLTALDVGVRHYPSLPDRLVTPQLRCTIRPGELSYCI